MKFLKTKNISKFSISDNTLIAYPSGATGKYSRVVIDATGGLMLPKGTGDAAYTEDTPQNQRPRLTGVRQPTDTNGTIRYNTTLSIIEAYVGGAWVTVASPLGSAITTEQLTPQGDGFATIFGPLNTAYAPSYAASADNILVLVENVMQISTTNFTVVQNPTSTGPTTGAEINATALSSSNNGTSYVITSVGTTTFTSFGAAANTVGTVFTKSGGTPTGSGKVRIAGYYLTFTSAVPASGGGGNPVYVTVYYGYAN
jgi:hypothetical protein